MYNYTFHGKLVLSDLRCCHCSFVKIMLNFYTSRIIEKFKSTAFLDCILFVFHIFRIKLVESVRMLFSTAYLQHSGHCLQ